MSKDAAATRLLLVQAARRRFAFDGYRATTVRDIAGDAGVNVALINRYFGSKEGLFRACLDRVVRDLGAEETSQQGLERALTGIITHIVRAPTDDDSLQLMLLLRSSGDDGADAIRRETLRRYAERLAGTVGGAGSEELLVRAEIALAVVLGMSMLRQSTAVEPLASADDAVVSAALEDALRALLAPPR
ncbi:TetR/AcrR family transcriptional regulator [Curtobacterium flaccumfaciens]|jgi:AcrR family transcriptional regulator|uniref:TetR/AcrR family transcriptional regulator n=1 Tax=Curtobacterium flaccumfaciens TaxID=2035 RepID=UPI001BDE9330|nr:TetR/AcrR family transcriptional regulator [Curtobacterium flaccumfaciens]MBT1681660.1 TetR/AcrR family transcriptional regulator [Curtobacterium flaccumfaciens pv. flaccumfaciens]MCS6549491.1 TetR family transcriptional regulator [Curtobacterium flaccumfaciens pv. flaccumfaciens]MCS6555156.1 TetR family transcriptional regulator [Curtobacterium flaccumfaciens]